MSELANFPPETRVGIYNRVSTEKKVQLEALDKQVEYTRKLVLENHLTLVNQYVEPESGTEAEHRYEYNVAERYSGKQIGFSCREVFRPIM